MSRFESSRFVRNPQIMNANVLMAACETLGWKYSLQNNILLVTEVGNDSNFHGEFALRLDVSTNEVTYNTYAKCTCKSRRIKGKVSRAQC